MDHRIDILSNGNAVLIHELPGIQIAIVADGETTTHSGLLTPEEFDAVFSAVGNGTHEVVFDKESQEVRLKKKGSRSGGRLIKTDIKALTKQTKAVDNSNNR